jgi:serine/threonine-protein kinase
VDFDAYFLLPGDSLGPFVIREILGTGSTGIVYRVFDTRSQQERALKLLSPDISEAAREELIFRYHQEAKLAGQLKHPNLIPVYEAGEHNGLPYLLMEHRAAPTLAHRLKKGPLPLSEAVSLLRQLASALSLVHAQGIVHRDLKPTNILYDARGLATLIDFGIARLRGSSLTRAGVIMGALGYCAPEQIQMLQPVDPRADLFALGILFFVVLTGRRPFPTDSMERYAEAVLHEAAPPPSLHAPHLPRPVDAVVEKLLQKDPGDRYQNAEELLADLLRL